MNQAQAKKLIDDLVDSANEYYETIAGRRDCYSVAMAKIELDHAKRNLRRILVRKGVS